MKHFKSICICYAILTSAQLGEVSAQRPQTDHSATEVAESTQAVSESVTTDLKQKTDARLKCKSTRILFSVYTNKISSAELAKLERLANCLAKNSNMSVLLQGNIDRLERGSEAYALYLGEHMTDIVRTQLERLMVDRERIDQVSFGYERPLCSERTIKCIRENNRVDISVY